MEEKFRPGEKLVSEQAKKNTLFAKKIKEAMGIKEHEVQGGAENYPVIHSIFQNLINEGSERVEEFEQYLIQKKKKLADLTPAVTAHPSYQHLIAEQVNQFFQATSDVEKDKITENLAKLI